nr:transposase domain-containing protein [Cryobacterium psychrophilum]
MARSGWVKPVSDRRLSDFVSVGLLTRVFPAGVVDEVIAAAGRTEVRQRALPARVMAYFSIGMALYSEDSYEDVFLSSSSQHQVSSSRHLSRQTQVQRVRPETPFKRQSRFRLSHRPHQGRLSQHGSACPTLRSAIPIDAQGEGL